MGTFHSGASFVKHDVVTDGDAPMGWVAGEGGVFGQEAGLMQEVSEQGAEFIEHLWANGMEEVAQARGRGGDALLEAEEASPTCSVLASQEFGQVPPTQVQFPAQADAEEEGDGIERELTFGALDILQMRIRRL